MPVLINEFFMKCKLYFEEVEEDIGLPYFRSLANQTVDETPNPSFPTTWYRDANTSPMWTG